MPASGPKQSDCRVERLEVVDSTNSEALRQAAAGERGPLWLVGGRQTGGRGRDGRAWVSEPGNLHGSLLLAPRCRPEQLSQLSLAGGVAVYDAVAELGGGGVASLRLKWPNDLLIGRAKAAGILVESTAFKDGPVAVIGVGVNVARAPMIGGRDVTCLVDHGIAADAGLVGEVVCRQLVHWLRVWDGGVGMGAIIAAWVERCGPMGEVLTVGVGSGVFTGRFAGLDHDGALMLTCDGGDVRRIMSGEVWIAARDRAERRED